MKIDQDAKKQGSKDVKKNNENGYSVVVVPIILGVLLLLITFIFEYGRYVTIKHQLQSAVDSAVLAGVSMCKVKYKDITQIGDNDEVVETSNTEIVLVEDKAIGEARNYFDKNLDILKLNTVNINDDDISIKVENNTLQMEIKAEIKGVFLTPLFGEDERLIITVRAKAKPVDV